MTDFVLRDVGNQDHVTSFIQCCKYARFLKQPLELGIFVPCDEDGSVLEQPITYWNWIESDGLLQPYDDKMKEYWDYYKAKERVLFDTKNGR